jgi:hypothetical protein
VKLSAVERTGSLAPTGGCRRSLALGTLAPAARIADTCELLEAVEMETRLRQQRPAGDEHCRRLLLIDRPVRQAAKDQCRIAHHVETGPQLGCGGRVRASVGDGANLGQLFEDELGGQPGLCKIALCHHGTQQLFVAQEQRELLGRRGSPGRQAIGGGRGSWSWTRPTLGQIAN